MGLVLLFALAPALCHAADYYVDCEHGSDSATGREAAKAWRTLSRVNAIEYAAGDSIRLKRGTTCEGALSPKGSGTADHPITVGVFGTGALPVVMAKGAVAGIELFNQHHWEIHNLEVTGSSEYGIHISGDSGLLSYFRIVDCIVHGVHSKQKMRSKISGLVVFDATGPQRFEDILIDGVTAYDTNRWAGIVVQGRGDSRKVTIRNATVHHVYGDGIILFSLRDGVIERSAAWYTGLELTYSIGSPNSIWTWACKDCIVRENEGFFSDSPTVDGGVYDIDFYNERNVVENNYGHDSQGYCVAVFGAANTATIASEVRGNLCAGNGRSPRLAMRYGDIYLYTWNKGSLDGVNVHENTVIWEPSINAPAVSNDAAYSGTGRNSFENNLIVSRVGSMVHSNASLLLDRNRYINASRGSWTWNGADFDSFVEYQKASGQDTHSSFSDAMPEFLKTPEAVPTSSEIDTKPFQGSYALIAFLDSSAQARSQAVVLRSAAFQYRAKGLRTAIMSESPLQFVEDWKFDGLQIRVGRNLAGKLLLTLLLDPLGRTLYRWEGYAPAKQVTFAVRKLLGAPEPR